MNGSTSPSAGIEGRPGKLILVVGLGSVGSLVLDLLLRLPGNHRFLVGGRDLRRIRERTNLALFAATQLGFRPAAECVHVDLQDVGRTAELLAQRRPNLVFNAATLQPWGAIQDLPPREAERLRAAQIGPWLPVHLSLVRKLMGAVRDAGSPTIVVNATYPDVVHPVLARLGLAPTTGIGDLANNVPALQLAAATALDVSPSRIEVRLVAQHHVSYWMSRLGHSDGAPFHLAILLDGDDVTREVDVGALLRSLSGELRRAGGNLMTATSAAVVIGGLLNDTGTVTHAPGPLGLPGGYPIRTSSNGLSVVLPKGLELDRAVEINSRAQRWDGIERIDDDGTVHFAPEQMEVMREVLGYECQRLALEEVDGRAAELLQRHRERAAQR